VRDVDTQVVRDVDFELSDDDDESWKLVATVTSPNAAEPPPTASTGPAIWPLVIADLQRDEIGTAKYGVPLQARNGRRLLIDAYQENLDCAVYLRQAIEEGVDVRAEYVLVLSLLVSLRKTIEAQP